LYDDDNNTPFRTFTTPHYRLTSPLPPSVGGAFAVRVTFMFWASMKNDGTTLRTA